VCVRRGAGSDAFERIRGEEPMTRDEAQSWFVQVLMHKVREDHYPSVTQLALIEESIPSELVDDYVEILMEKVAQDNVPSVPMLRRIQRVAASLPSSQQQSR
jgi:hypothetical protein